MDRRTFIRTLVPWFMIAPLGAIAPAATIVRHIGWLDGSVPDLGMRQEFDARLRDLGWIEGTNLIIDRRYADSKSERLQGLADELVRRKVELIVTVGTPATVAAKKATTTIPIVIHAAGDPVATGLVGSLARPGGNITGYSIDLAEHQTKALALLHEALPAARRVGVLVPSTNPISSVWLKQTEPAFRSLAMQPITVEVTNESQLENAIADIARRGAEALIVIDEDLFYAHRVRIMNAALRYALPTVVGGLTLLEAGGMLSYSASDSERARRCAALVDKILRGAKPADLPVEQPMQFVMGINLKTARALGINIPKTLLLRADEVIQ